jgi:hypothetical protein
MDYVPLEGVTASGDTRSTYMEWIKGPGWKPRCRGRSSASRS